MNSRTQAHVFHLKTKSYSVHKAMQEYYESIGPLLDSYAEVYQGKYGRVLTYKKSRLVTNNIPGYFGRLLTVITAVKTRDSFLNNIRDEIIALVYQTLYRLGLNK